MHQLSNGRDLDVHATNFCSKIGSFINHIDIESGNGITMRFISARAKLPLFDLSSPPGQATTC